MKNIKVTKKVWRQLSKSKQQWGFNTLSQTIGRLLNSQPGLYREILHEIHDHVDALKIDKNLGEKIQPICPEVIEFICLECGKPISVSKNDQDDVGLYCPECSWPHCLLVCDWIEDVDDECL